MQPYAGIPIFGLVLVIGIAVLGLAIWLLIFDRNGIIARGPSFGVILPGAVLTGMGIALVMYGGSKLRRIVRDLSQLLLVFDHGVAHIRPEETRLYSWPKIKEVRHQSVQLEYDGMSIGVEHAYTIIDEDGQPLVLLGRSYPSPDGEPSGDPLADVEQVGNFIQSKTN